MERTASGGIRGAECIAKSLSYMEYYSSCRATGPKLRARWRAYARATVLDEVKWFDELNAERYSVLTQTSGTKKRVFSCLELRKDAYRAGCGSIIATAVNRAQPWPVQMICLNHPFTQSWLPVAGQPVSLHSLLLQPCPFFETI